MTTRLQKVLAEAGFGSRRGCEMLIDQGRVSVDGSVATVGITVDPEKATISVDGLPIHIQPKEYWLLNKPKGVLSAAIDSRGRTTVVDCVPSNARLFPVGRLDLNSTGLILLTNDGELTDRLLHPRYHVEKEYRVIVRGVVEDSSLQRLRDGVSLDDGGTQPAVVRRVQAAPTRDRPSTTLVVVVREGRKRQVRRMCEAVGHRVVELHRQRFATLTDSALTLGEARRLTREEVSGLRKLAGLS